MNINSCVIDHAVNSFLLKFQKNLLYYKCFSVCLELHLTENQGAQRKKETQERRPPFLCEERKIKLLPVV